MNNKQAYNDNSISQLKGADRVRLRPEALLGSRGLDGAKHTVWEIIGNSVDEKLSGFGSKIIVGLNPDDSIYVRDYGRGIPMGWNEKEEQYNWYLIFCELYAGGKYGKNQEILQDIEKRNAWDDFRIENYSYLTSIGLNGLGCAITQCTSKYFIVKSYRDGKKYEMHFENGEPAWSEMSVETSDEPNGTYICWKPDDKVFTDTHIPAKWLENIAKTLSYVAGIDIEFNDNGVVNTYPASSISNIMRENAGKVAYAHSFKHIIDNEGDICICDAEIALGPKGHGSDYFHNKVSVSGGAHSTGYSSGVSQFFLMISQNTGVRIREQDYSGLISCIISTLANKASLRNQTKDSIDDNWIMVFLSDSVYDLLRKEYDKGTPWLKEVVDTAVENAKNRIAVAEMAKNLREVQSSVKKHKTSQKFTSCRTYTEGRTEETEFFIAEGDSAGGQIITSRDSSYQCVLPIRGKSLNLYKASIEKLVGNREIRDIISILGCGIDLGIEEIETFNRNKLKVGKVIIAADADEDGKHICMLIAVMFIRLFPQLLYEGRLYKAEPPLYVINLRNGDRIYCVNEAELQKKREEYAGSISSVDRMKGLGEMDPEDLSKTILNPATRHLTQIKIDPEDSDVYATLELLFGKSTAERKRIILGSILGTNFDDAVSDMQSISEYIEGLDLDQDLTVENINM